MPKKTSRRLVIRTIRTSFGIVKAQLECGHEVALGESSSAGLHRQSRIVCPECLDEQSPGEETTKVSSKKPRRCSRCGCKLRSGNNGPLCWPCRNQGAMP